VTAGEAWRTDLSEMGHHGRPVPVDQLLNRKLSNPPRCLVRSVRQSRRYCRWSSTKPARTPPPASAQSHPRVPSHPAPRHAARADRPGLRGHQHGAASEVPIHRTLRVPFLDLVGQPDEQVNAEQNDESNQERDDVLPAETPNLWAPVAKKSQDVQDLLMRHSTGLGEYGRYIACR